MTTSRSPRRLAVLAGAAALVLAPLTSGAAQARTIDGTTGNDHITGTPQADRIEGYKGYDHIDGAGGPDFVAGGTGNDVIVGGTGNDTLAGDAGDDHESGGPGNDTMSNDTGNDVADGGPGNDSIHGGSGNDRLTGSDGDDVLYGDPGNDLVSGDAGNDHPQGGPGNDVVWGGSGRDELDGDKGNDFLYAGPGDDGCRLKSGARQSKNCHRDTTGDQGNDVMYPGSGIDEMYGEQGINAIVATDDGVYDELACEMDNSHTRDQGLLVYVGRRDPHDHVDKFTGTNRSTCKIEVMSAARFEATYGGAPYWWPLPGHEGDNASSFVRGHRPHWDGVVPRTTSAQQSTGGIGPLPLASPRWLAPA